MFQRVGITPPKGCLLYGPPGTGKTLLARAVASQLDANFLKVSYNTIFFQIYSCLQCVLTWINPKNNDSLLLIHENFYYLILLKYIFIIICIYIIIIFEH